MESYLNENFGEVKPKNSSEEALQRWRKLCWLVKNRKRRFRFTANLSKRFEAEAIRRSNQVPSFPRFESNLAFYVHRSECFLHPKTELQVFMINMVYQFNFITV